VPKTKEIIEQNLPKMKITYSNEVNKRHSSGYAGLRNLGNICYMNSMLQQLYMNQTFKKLLLRVDDEKPEELTFDMKGNTVDDNFLHQVQRIFGYLDKTTRQEVSPIAFCTAYKPFGGSIDIMLQQDVQEFVSMFFDRLEEGIKGNPFERLV
jgi:ubiquitin carboxyl-terminal hydrolase 34